MTEAEILREALTELQDDLHKRLQRFVDKHGEMPKVTIRQASDLSGGLIGHAATLGPGTPLRPWAPPRPRVAVELTITPGDGVIGYAEI